MCAPGLFSHQMTIIPSSKGTIPTAASSQKWELGGYYSHFEGQTPGAHQGKLAKNQRTLFSEQCPGALGKATEVAEHPLRIIGGAAMRSRQKI
jgi:hypothetical protein